MFDKLISLGALMVFGGMLYSAVRPDAHTALVISAASKGFSRSLLASEGRIAPY